MHTPLDLEDHADTTLISIARGINDADQTVGDRQTASGWRAITWNDTGDPFDLGAAWLAAGGISATDTFARDINNLGQVAMQVPVPGGTAAALWHPALGFTVIDLIDGFSAGATAVNDDGVVVGTSAAPGASGQQAFVWTAAGGTQTLTSLLDGASSGSWLIQSASGISENGHIVGRGWHPALGFRGVLLTPVPEPSGALLALAGLAVLVGWQRLSAGGYAASGSARHSRVPPEGAGNGRRLPPCNTATRWAIASPRPPMPPLSRRSGGSRSDRP